MLHFDTPTLIITLTGFYTMFGHTLDSVRNFFSYLKGDVGARICTLHPAVMAGNGLCSDH